ncbi:antitoxin [Streptomyces sp. NPDC047981]|uniref:antitoxin n=1 Tax=Streptomyces sp. NPDC047981 TaxID=3154610 RepID=UPI00343B4345
MGLLDSLKAKLAPAKDKVSGLAQQHEAKIDQGLDKAAKLVDEKTKGKYSATIESGTGKAKDALERIAHKDDADGGAKGSGESRAPGQGQSPGQGPAQTPGQGPDPAQGPPSAS